MSTPTGEPNPNEHRNAKADAKAAKAYAKATRPWYKKKRWWLAGIVLVIIIASALGSGGTEETDPTASDPTATAEPTATEEPAEEQPAEEESAEEEPKPEPQAVQVRAAVMLKDFEDNELAADRKYEGKTLRITGVVDSIDTDILDEDQYILRLGGGGDFEILTVNCNDMSTDELSTLNAGDNVTVIGEFDDGGDLGVEVSNCRLAS